MSFGQELKDFASGFRQGVQIANQTRDSQTRAERYKPAPTTSGDTGPFTGGTGPQVRTSTDPGQTSSTGSAKPGEIEQYIRVSASKRGIDPDIAVKVARSEGGLNDPVRQSDYVNPKTGKRERSYGPFQLYLDGGLGNKALEAGIDPRDPKQWREAVDFALDNAKTSGWGQWYGAKKVGVDDWDGIGGPKRGPTTAKKGATANVSYDDKTVIPEPEGEPADDGGEAAPVEEEKPAVEPGEVSFALPEVELPEVTGWEEWMQRGTMMAEKGGVIPETRYAGGGTTDPYSSERTYTQQIPERAQGPAPNMQARPTFVPSRIRAPNYATAQAAGGGGGAAGGSVAEWEAGRAKLAADRKAAADAAAAKAAADAAAKAQTPAGYTKEEMRKFQVYRMLGIPAQNPQALLEKATPQQYTDLRMMGYGGGFGSSVGNPGWNGAFRRGGSGRAAGGMVYTNFASGGVVPEPGEEPVQEFARGGAVSIDPSYWEEAVAREERRPRYGASAGESARDIAAKRINRATRGITSSAMPTGRRGTDGGGGGGRGRKLKTRVDQDGEHAITSPTPKESVGGGKASKPDTKTKKKLDLPDLQRNPYETQRTDPAYRDDVVRRRQDEPRGPDPMSALPEDERERDTSLDDMAPLPRPDPSVVEPNMPPPPVKDKLGPDERSNPPGLTLDDVASILSEIGTGAEPKAEGGVAGVLPDVAAPVDAEHDQPRGGGWPVIGEGSPRNVVSTPPPSPGATPAIPETPVPKAPPTAYIFGQPVPMAPAAGGAATGEGLDLEDIKQSIKDAAQQGGETAAATLKQIADSVQEYLSQSNSEATFTWHDLVNLIMDDNYKGPEGEGVLFARGGAVPEEDEEAPERMPPLQTRAGYTTSGTGERSSARQSRQSAPQSAPSSVAEEGEPPAEPKTNVKPTKRLRDSVAIALDGGIKFLNRHFGLAGEGGAVPSPNDEAMQREGSMRMLKGEGAATPDEIQDIDAKIDPGNNLNEAQRVMNRYAATMEWYASRGRKDEAEAAAASLMQYGRQQFGQLGSLAAHQYDLFEQTGDQDYLQNTVDILEKAYALVPDGGDMDVEIGPNGLLVTRTDVNGNERTIPVQAEELPELIKGVQSGSEYWNSIYRIADPAGAKEEATERRQAARDERTATRQEEHDVRLEEYRQGREDTRAAAALDKEARQAKAEQERFDRNQKAQDDRWARQHPRTDYQAAQPLIAAARAAQKANQDEGTEESQAAYNKAASDLFNFVSKTERDPAEAMGNLGIPMMDFDLVSNDAAPAEPRQAPDGKWYVLKPNGKYAEVEAPAGG